MGSITRIVIAALVVALISAPAWAYPGSQYAKQAKVSMLQARSIALKAYPGKIVTEELEKESGGSGLRYSFVIQQGTTKHEVGVDAASGKLLQNAVEGKDAD